MVIVQLSLNCVVPLEIESHPLGWINDRCPVPVQFADFRQIMAFFIHDLLLLLQEVFPVNLLRSLVLVCVLLHVVVRVIVRV
mgnify:CR=1 FL=1